jgi:transposase
MAWNQGKSRVSLAMMKFLGSWARVLSWREVARRFGSSWDSVCASVEWMVKWGLAQRELKGVEAVGIDEIHWGPGKRAENFLTVIYQLDEGARRLLWVGTGRSAATLRAGLGVLGEGVVKGLKFVCSDMWKPYMKEIAKQAGGALHVLDRFHIASHLNKAVDEVRRAEGSRLKGQAAGQKLKKMRWHLLKKSSRVRGRARSRLNELIASKLMTAKAWVMKEAFQHFWKYKSAIWAGGYLDDWCRRVMRSRIEPMKRVARMLRKHEQLILNWFEAKGEISSGVVEGLNNKIRVVTRRSYGFRTYRVMELALYHTLGRLPEPKLAHEFF